MPLLPRRQLSPAAVSQLLQDLIHASVAVIVVICTTFLAYVGKIPSDVIGAVFTGVVGYVAGRAGSTARSGPSRSDDLRPEVVNGTNGADT